MFSLPPLLSHPIVAGLLAFVSAIALGAGLRLLRMLKVAPLLSLGERLIFGMALGYGLLGFIMLAMGLLGVIYRPLSFGLLALLLIAGFAPLRDDAPLLWATLRRAAAGLRYPPNAFLALVIIVVVGAA